jgi:hypothetical protein
MRIAAIIILALCCSIGAFTPFPGTLDCTSAFSHNHDSIREGRIVISSWQECVMRGKVGAQDVTLFADGACALRNSVPGEFNVRYDATCGQVLDLSTDALPPYCPPTSTPTATPSPSPTPASSGIKGVSILESDGTQWSLGSNLETLRNGVHASGGFGSIYKLVNGRVYVKGMDAN